VGITLLTLVLVVIQNLVGNLFYMANELDQDVVALAKAIRQHETGNRQVAGASGEIASRYQFLPSTWKASAAKYLGNANAPVTLENENKVAYSQIKEWKDKGYNPGQIAAAWNAGEGKVKNDAWKTNVGVNDAGVRYDTPSYVNSVYSNYQKIKGQTPQQPAQQAKQPESGVLNAVQNIPTSILRGITQPGEFFARLGQTVGDKLAGAVGDTSVGSALRKVAGATGLTSSQSIQNAQDLAQGLKGEKVVLPGQTDALFNEITPFKSVKEGLGEAGEAALNIGLAALPAGKVGGAVLKGLGAKQGLLTAGKQFAPRLLEAGGVGLGYTASNALQEDRLPTAGELATGTLTGCCGSYSWRWGFGCWESNRCCSKQHC
jgi:hypothetical protein